MMTNETAPRILIHTCKKREWYVRGFLLPSLLEQGFTPDRLKVYYDSRGEGNLTSWAKSFYISGLHEGGTTWHLQDDVVLSKDFKKMVEEWSDAAPVVCGFCYYNAAATTVEKQIYEGCKNRLVQPAQMWWSFPCIKVDNDIAKEAAIWFKKEALIDIKYMPLIELNKGDDAFFKDYLIMKYDREKIVYNLAPNIVEHVDYLLGGSLVNETRGKATGLFFEDQGEVKELEEKLKAFKSGKGIRTDMGRS